MGRIFEIQAKKVDTFRRKKRRKLKKGDVLRIGSTTTPDKIRKHLDLRPKTKDILDTRKYGNRLVNSGGDFWNLEMGQSPGGDGFSGSLPDSGDTPISPEAQLVLDRMTSLDSTEEAAIINFVDAEVTAGNWDLYDEFFCFSLNETDSLIGFKSKTATAINAPIHSVDGYTLNGTTQYIDTNFIPSVDGVNYTLNDASINGFVHEKSDNIIGFDTIMGAFVAGKATLIDIQPDYQTRNYLNGANVSTDDTVLGHSTLISLDREDSANVKTYRNGIINKTIANVSGAITDITLYVGALNNGGTPANYYDGILSTIKIGGGIGFDQAAHNTNIRELLRQLNVAAVLNRFSSLSALETTSIETFVNAEIAADNWHKYDDFWCFGLNSTDRLIGFKSNTAFEVGTVTFDIHGVTVPEGDTDYIDLNYTPKSAQRRYNFLFEAFCYANTSIENFKAFFGTAAIRVSLLQQPASNRIAYYAQSGTASTYAQGAPNYVLPNTLYTVVRGDINNGYLYRDGLQVSTNANVGSGTMLLGYRIGHTIASTTSTGLVGQAAGFDHATHNTNLRALLTALGII